MTCVVCGRERKHHAKNMCSVCYHAQLKKEPRLCVSCGNLKTIHARERCARCYHEELRASKPPCKCGAAYHHNGLCGACYQSDRRAKQPDGACRTCGKSTRIATKDGRCAKCYSSNRVQYSVKCACGRGSVAKSMCGRCYARFKLYGMDAVTFYEESKRGCRLCGAFKKLCVDHSHTTGDVRGLLCGNCNIALGFLEQQTERAEWCSRALKYLGD